MAWSIGVTCSPECIHSDGEPSAGLAGKRAEFERTRAQIERLIDTIVEGTPAAAVNGRMAALEARRLTLEAELATTQAPAPRLQPNLAELYRQRVAELTRLLEQDDATAAREMVRALIEAIHLIPEGGALRVEVRGELGAILRLAECARNAKSPSAYVPEGLVWVCSV
jgi:site-specific DNA recombinase